MTDWRALAEELYLPLKVSPCRCQYERNAAGVPLWSGEPIERRRTYHCGRCKALDAYEEAAAEATAVA